MIKRVKRTESYSIPREELEKFLRDKLIANHIDTAHVEGIEFNWDMQCDQHGDDQELKGVEVEATVLLDEGSEEL